MTPTTAPAPSVEAAKAVERPRCLGCGVAVRAASLPLCVADRDRAEAVFRLSHSPLDRDWIAARNRFWGRPEVVRAALEMAS